MKNIVGIRFGKLEIIEFVGSKQFGKTKKRLYRAKCDCGGEITAIGESFKSGKTTSCGCLRWQSGNNSKKWNGFGEISGDFWDRTKRSALNRKLEFSISIEEAWNLFLKQERRCSISGLPLVFFFSKSNKNQTTASLDRINSNLGYVSSNIQWIHKDINKMKNSFDENYFVEICDLISKNKLGNKK